jgi:hypothetical protein
VNALNGCVRILSRPRFKQARPEGRPLMAAAYERGRRTKVPESGEKACQDPRPRGATLSSSKICIRHGDLNSAIPLHGNYFGSASELAGDGLVVSLRGRSDGIISISSERLIHLIQKPIHAIFFRARTRPGRLCVTSVFERDHCRWNARSRLRYCRFGVRSLPKRDRKAFREVDSTHRQAFLAQSRKARTISPTAFDSAL